METNKTETLIEKLDKLEKALEASHDNIVQGPAYDLTNIYPEYRHLLNKQAQEALDRPNATNQIRQKQGSMEVELAEYFTVRAVGKHNIPKAVEKIIEVLNKHSEEIICPLIALSYIELYYLGYGPKTENNTEYVVYSFPILSQKGYWDVRAAKYDVNSVEGGISSVVIKDPDPIKPEGFATHTLGLSIRPADISPDFSDRLEERKNLLLTILPKGTEIVAIDKSHDITMLAEYFRFTLKHPFFKAGMTIELDECRIAWPTEDGHIEQGNVLFGVRYVEVDGKDHFRPTPDSK